MTAAFDAGDLYESLRTYLETLKSHEDELNRLNVYPVPDSDTGTNMRATVEAVMESARASDSAAALCAAVERGSLMGARGNSGVILGQAMIAVARALAGSGSLDANGLASALEQATRAAYDSVTKPVEGTILTVARAASLGGVRAASGGSVVLGVMETACENAAAALRDTQNQLPVLKEAGVVDAAGKGLLLFLQCIRGIAGGAGPDDPEIVERADVPSGVTGPRFEVILLLRGSAERVRQLEGAWANLGESVVVGGGDERWKCHVHTDDVEAALAAAHGVGEISDVRVTDLYEEATEGPPRIVAVTGGEDAAELFESFGATCVRADGLDDDGAFAAVLSMLGEMSGPAVVLANHPAIADRADEIMASSAGEVEVVRSRSAVQGLAALLAADPEDPRAEAMTETVESVRYGEVRPHDDGYAGIAGDARIQSAPTPSAAGDAVVDHLITDVSEVITVLTGRGVDDDEVARFKQTVRSKHPHVAMEVHRGGQESALVIGVE